MPFVGFYLIHTRFANSCVHIKAFGIVVVNAVQKIFQTFFIVVWNKPVVQIYLRQIEIKRVFAEAQSFFVPLYGFGNVFQFFIV